jgi:hypothetical protein
MSESDWNPAVSESPRKYTDEKFPAFAACAAVRAACGLDDEVVEQADSATIAALAIQHEIERGFIFMTKEASLNSQAPAFSGTVLCITRGPSQETRRGSPGSTSANPIR